MPKIGHSKDRASSASLAVTSACARRSRGRAERPRLVVFRSLKHIYAQLVDDVAQRTLHDGDRPRASRGQEDREVAPKWASGSPRKREGRRGSRRSSSIALDTSITAA